MLPIYNLGHTFRTIYEQAQKLAPPIIPTEPTAPRLAGGLWSAFKFEEAAAKYKQHLDQHYGFLHILGHNRPVPLEGIFTDVYLYDRPLAQRRLDLKDLEEGFRERQLEQKGAKQVDGLSLVKTESRLFILGQPGAGKTTFLKHVALQAAQGNLPGIPIFISLKALADSQKPLLDFMAQEMHICGFPEPAPFLQVMLQSGQMMILLDGLDEVTQAQETALNLIQSIENLSRQYSANHFLITCRIAVTDYQFPGFTTVEVANFSKEQITIFIHKWFQGVPSQSKACLHELNQPEYTGLYNLARTPLFLNLLCLTYSEMRRFPKRQVDLYEESLDALLSKWDRSKPIQREEIYRQLNLNRKRQLLAYIAASTFQKGQYLIPKAEMLHHILDYFRAIPEIGPLDEIDAEAVLRTIETQYGILVEHANRVYGFAHLTFHEYFTAKHFAESGKQSWSMLLPHYTEPQWREVFILTISLLQEADDFFHHFITELYQPVTQDSQLLALLTWATQKANDGLEAPRLLNRVLYTYLAHAHTRAHAQAHVLAQDHAYTYTLAFALDFALAPDHALASALDLALDLDLDLDLANALASAHSLALDLDVSYTLVSARDRAPARALAPAFALALDLDLALAPLTALDFALIYGWFYSPHGSAHPFIYLAQKLSRTQSLASLQAALDSLIIPVKEAPEHEHRRLAEALWRITQQERQLHTFELNYEQTVALATYLEGTQLLVQCLKLSAVTNRDAILSRLLTPPPV